MNRSARLTNSREEIIEFFLSGLKENQLVVVRKRDIKMGFQVISDLKIRTLRYIISRRFVILNNRI